MWHCVGRWLVRLPHLSLVNILAGKELVPEFMPYFTSTKPIIDRAHGLLSTPARLSQTSQSLLTLIDPLTQRRSPATPWRISYWRCWPQINELAEAEKTKA